MNDEQSLLEDRLLDLTAHVYALRVAVQALTMTSRQPDELRAAFDVAATALLTRLGVESATEPATVSRPAQTALRDRLDAWKDLIGPGSTGGATPRR
jgi:hypothetical protein